MRKSDFYRKVNRNSNSIFSNTNRTPPRNVISPELFVDHIWLSDDVTTGAQVTELISEHTQASPGGNHQTFGHAWSYINKDRFEVEDNIGHRSNNGDRETEGNEYQFQYTKKYYPVNNDNEYSFSTLYGSRSNDMSGHNDLHQMNCFTIIDKHRNIDSGSSSDEYANIEEINGENMWKEYWQDNLISKEGTAQYNSDIETEKRMICIYSFENKRLLPDNDLELVNIPSRDTSTSCSIEDFAESEEETTSFKRLSSPIPSSYLPKMNLDLTPTLPTVTEVSEPIKQSMSNQTEVFINQNSAINKKPLNNWFLSQPDTPNSISVEIKNKGYDVINWMALSPRDRKRRFRNTHTQCQNMLPTLREVSNYTEQKLQDTHNIDSQKSIVTQTHAEVEFEKKSARIAAADTDELKDNSDEEDIEKYTPEDIGDHVTNRCLRRPNVRCSSSRLNKIKTTDPIEKLNGGGWITEHHLLKSDNDEETRRHLHCPGDVLVMRTMSLLKPAQWADYLPITEGVPSLHLSITTDFEETPWYRRLAKCFRCCK